LFVGPGRETAEGPNHPEDDREDDEGSGHSVLRLSCECAAWPRQLNDRGRGTSFMTFYVLALSGLATASRIAVSACTFFRR
jgi:hypothetical protein